MKNCSPQNRVSLDIDAQCTFTPLCPTELPVPDGNAIVDELNAQAQFAEYRVGTKDAHSPYAVWVADETHPVFTPIAGTNVDVRWPLHAVPGTRGFELIDGLPSVTDYDFFVWKGIEPDLHPYGACYHDLANTLSTGLIEFLKQHDIQLVIAGGLATDHCVKTTVLQLLRAGFKVIVNLGACRGISPEAIERAIAAMRDEGAIIIQSAAELPLLLN